MKAMEVTKRFIWSEITDSLSMDRPNIAPASVVLSCYLEHVKTELADDFTADELEYLLKVETWMDDYEGV